MGRDKNYSWKVCSSHQAECGTWDTLFPGFYSQMAHTLDWSVMLILSDSSNSELLYAELDSYTRKDHPTIPTEVPRKEATLEVMSTFRTSEEINLQTGFCYFPDRTQLWHSAICCPFLRVTNGLSIYFQAVKSVWIIMTGSKTTDWDPIVVNSCPSPFSVRTRVSWGEEEDLQWLTSNFIHAYYAEHLCWVATRMSCRNLCSITQANFISGRLCWNDKNSRHCLKLRSPIFCNWLLKANSSILFQALPSQNLCALMGEVRCKLTADRTILTIPTKRKSLTEWVRGLTTYRNCVYTDISVCIKKCFNISLRHNLCITKKFNHISCKCFFSSVIELHVDSLKR